MQMAPFTTLSASTGSEDLTLGESRRVTADAVIESFGAQVRVAGCAGVVAHITRLVGRAATTVSGDAAYHDASLMIELPARGAPGRVTLDGQVCAVETDESELLRRALSELHLAVAVHARRGAFVHAGAVSWMGVGIVIPGRSMTGKTTLVRELVDVGAGYMSDEYAVLDRDGRVQPYAKSLGVRGDSGYRRVVPESLGRVEGDPVPVGFVLDTCYEADAVWDPEQHIGAQVVIPLVDNAVAARIAPVRVLEATAAVARSGAVLLTGPRGDARHTARRVLECVDAFIDSPHSAPLGMR